jgi:hypothetical protein
MGVGLSVGTNGIIVGEHSDDILVSRLSYSVAITGWVHVAVVYRTDSIFLFLNGSMVRSRQIPCTDERTVSSTLAGSCYSQKFKGDIDEYRLWDISLSPQEVSQAADKKLLNAVYGLRYYASFDGGKFERTLGDLGDQNMTACGLPPSKYIKFSDWDFGRYHGSSLNDLTIFNVHDLSYIWSVGSTNKSIAFTPTEGQNTIFVKIFNPVYSKNALFSIIDSITITGTICSTTPETGLVAYYPMNGNARDESIFKNDGIVEGALSVRDINGVQGKALLFDGTDDFIKINGSLPVANTFTISFLAYSENESGYSNIIGDGSSDTDGNDFFINFQGNTIGLRADKDAALNYEESSPVELQDLNMVNKWVHVVWVMTPGFSKIFLNGVPIAILNETGSNVGFHDELSFIGARQVNGFIDHFFKGKLDELKIYNRELSDEEIQDLYLSYDVEEANKSNGTHPETSETGNREIVVYPNPASEYIIIDTGENPEFENGMIRIINMAGNTVYHSNISRTMNEINLSGWTNKGVFIVQVYDNKNILQAFRKIVTR